MCARCGCERMHMWMSGCVGVHICVCPCACTTQHPGLLSSFQWCAETYCCFGVYMPRAPHSRWCCVQRTCCTCQAGQRWLQPTEGVCTLCVIDTPHPSLDSLQNCPCCVQTKRVVVSRHGDPVVSRQGGICWFCLDKATLLCLDKATLLCLDKATLLCLDNVVSRKGGLCCV